MCMAIKKRVLSYRTFMKKNNIYLNGLNFQEVFDIVDNPKSQYSELILKNIIITGISIVSMAQISLSALPQKSDFVDKLPSYKDMRKKFISSNIGRTVAACIGIARAYPWLIQDPIMQGEDSSFKISQIIFDLVHNPIPNLRRIKPSIVEWQLYARCEAISSFGQILSCPSTNLKIMNMDGSQVKDYGLYEAFKIIGIKEEIFNKYSLNFSDIVNEIRSIFLINDNGLSINLLRYCESNTIYSKVQDEVLGKNILREQTLIKDLHFPLNSYRFIPKIQLEKVLSKYELIVYNFALKNRDKNILKKYNFLINERMKRFTLHI
uniref:putative group II intron reverse transcriptase/maturase mat6 n=1 Tax=Flexiglena variabilis TaxID=2743688 RepID=UPI0023AAE438|nr:putative group II intron reverse transcriptase/maturase mat6 [Flexiglena variabilis]WCH63522.1 putative group II intron reverse transcriptase/maturase mat6 [Flexiglena variabilis]